MVKEISRAINVNVTTLHNYDDCKNPNGVLQAIVNDTDGDGIGEPTGKFEYTWYGKFNPNVTTFATIQQEYDEFKNSLSL